MRNASSSSAAAATIAVHIARDLRTRLREGVPLPARLTLPSLAAHYGVSTTPVRHAVEILLGEGVLQRSPTGRLTVSPHLPPPGITAPFSASLPKNDRNDWENRLGAAIVARSLRGETGYLREQHMAEQLQVGRTVLRQAFSRLAGQGMLLHVPRCGWRVRDFDSDDLRAFLVAREAIERAALTLAVPHLDPDHLRALLHANAPEQVGDTLVPRLDNSLHRYFLDQSGNPYLRDFLDRHGLYYTFLFDFAAPEIAVVAETAAQHRTILQALLDGDPDRAAQALGEHIRVQEPIVARLMAQVAASA